MKSFPFAACFILLALSDVAAQSAATLTYHSPRVTFQYPASWGRALSVQVPDCRLEHATDKPDGVSPAHAAVFFAGGGRIAGESSKRCRVPDFERAQVRVFPARGWGALLPESAKSLAALEALLRDGRGDADHSIPFVPFIDASPAFTEHFQRVELKAGAGAGFLTQWRIEPDTLGARLVYVFQALSSDGTLYVLAMVPLKMRLPLPAFPVLTGEAWDAAEQRYAAYAANIAERLRQAKPDDFAPSLNEVLALCRSFDLR